MPSASGSIAKAPSGPATWIRQRRAQKVRSRMNSVSTVMNSAFFRLVQKVFRSFVAVIRDISLIQQPRRHDDGGFAPLQVDVRHDGGGERHKITRAFGRFYFQQVARAEVRHLNDFSDDGARGVFGGKP